MELMDGLLTRRSVRKYKADAVSHDDIVDIVKAGMYAPSARNQQIWEFVVITDKEKLVQISEALETAPMAKGAGFAILLCANPAREKAEGFWDQECGACIQNMLLGAWSKGIGTVWVGIHPRQDRIDTMRRICNVPNEIRPHSLMLGGYPENVPAETERFHPEFIHMNEWEEE